MPYDEYLADRIKQVLNDNHSHFETIKMMGGLCFKVDDKMLCGIHFDKKQKTNLLMARIGEEAYPEAIKHPEVLPMDFTGRPMKGYIFVKPDGYDLEVDLEHWIALCLAFNPFAKPSKKKKKSK